MTIMDWSKLAESDDVCRWRVLSILDSWARSRHREERERESGPWSRERTLTVAEVTHKVNAKVKSGLREITNL